MHLQIYKTMEHKFRKSDNGIDLQALLDFCKKEGATTLLGSRSKASSWPTILVSCLAKRLWLQSRLYRATPHERYNLLMQRCLGIVEHLNLQDIASFLNVTPKTISKIRKEITFGKE